MKLPRFRHQAGRILDIATPFAFAFSACLPMRTCCLLTVWRGVWGRGGEVVTVGEAGLRWFGRVQRRGQPVYRWEDEERGLSPPRKSTEEIYEVW